MNKLSSGVSVEVFESLDSTSLEAKRRQAAGANGPLWIIAKNQTAGYGRRSREWRQDAGDFAGTLLFCPKAKAENLGQLSFVTALAVAETMNALVKRDVTIKWPNDVLINGGKAAGILLERIGPKAQPLLAIGIGINVTSRPEGLPYPAARLIDHLAAAPSIEAIADSLDERFWTLTDLWLRDGFAPIRSAWLARAGGLGRAITVRLPTEEISGIFDDLDETGALVLRFDGGKRIISTGEVFFRPSGAQRTQD